MVSTSELAKKLDQLSSKISHTAGETVGAAASNLADSANDYMDSASDYVERNPMKGVAMATAVGVVIGSFLTLLFTKERD